MYEHDERQAEKRAEEAEWRGDFERDEEMVRQWEELCRKCNEAFNHVFGDLK